MVTNKITGNDTFSDKFHPERLSQRANSMGSGAL